MVRPVVEMFPDVKQSAEVRLDAGVASSAVEQRLLLLSWSAGEVWTVANSAAARWTSVAGWTSDATRRILETKARLDLLAPGKSQKSEHHCLAKRVPAPATEHSMHHPVTQQRQFLCLKTEPATA